MEEDEDQVVALVGRQIAETLPHLDFDDYTMRETFHRSMDTADPTCFVVDRAGEITGYLFALMNSYAFTTGLYVVQEVLYVAPEHRGGRAALMLTKEFIRWGEMLKAREIIFGISNKFQPERTARFFEHMGAEQVGVYLKKYGNG